MENIVINKTPWPRLLGTRLDMVSMISSLPFTVPKMATAGAVLSTPLVTYGGDVANKRSYSVA